MLGTTLSVANLKQPKPATMTLAEARFRFADLPDIERNKVFSALFRMSLIDGRPISPIEPQDNLKKAQVPLKAVEKLDSLVKLKLTPTLQGETEDFKRTRAVQAATMRRVSEAPDNDVELRPSPESPTNHPFRQPALYEQIGDVFQGEGSAYRAAERGEAETTRNVSTAIQTQHPYMPQVVGDLLGSLAASGWTLAKQVSFFDPTKQGQATRDEINPTGTTGEDWTGALLNIASWFSAERGLAAGERALTAGALREVATAPNVGRALIENGVPPKEAAKVALGVEQAVKTAPDDDVIRPYSTEWTDVEIYNDMFKGKDKEFIQARIDATVEAAGLPPIKKSPINAPKKATQEPTPVETPQATHEPAMAQSEAITEPLPGDTAPVLDSGTPNAPEGGALTPESSVKPKPIRSTKIKTALANASDERKAAYDAMIAARRARSAQIRKGGKKSGQSIFGPEDFDYFIAWAKEQGLEIASLTEDALVKFIKHIKADIGEDPAYWEDGLRTKLDMHGFSGTDKSVRREAGRNLSPENQWVADILDERSTVPDEETLRKAKDAVGGASNTADSVIASGRQMDDVEVLSNTLRRKDIVDQTKELREQVVRQVDEGDIDGATDTRRTLTSLEEEFIKLSHANRVSGAEQGRAFRIRRFDLERGYTVPESIARFKEKNLREPTPQERVDIETKADEHTKLSKGMAEAQDSAATEAAEEVFSKSNPRRTVGKKGGDTQRPKERDGERISKLVTELGAMRSERSESVSRAMSDAGLGNGKPVDLPKDEKELLNKLVREVEPSHTDLRGLIKEVGKLTDGRYSDIQIMDAYSGRGKTISNMVTDAKRMRREAKLRSQISDAIDGVFDAKPDAPDFGATVKKLQEQLKALRQRARYTSGEAEAQRISLLEKRLIELKNLKENGGFKPKRPMSAQEQLLHDQIGELQTFLRNKAKIADLEANISKAKRGEYAPAPKKERARELIKQERRIRDLQSELDAINAPKGFLELFGDALQNAGTTADNSGLMRHALKTFFTARTLPFAIKRGGQSFKALFDRDVWHTIQKNIRESSTYELAVDSKLPLNVDEVVREEDFRGTVNDLIKKKTPWLNDAWGVRHILGAYKAVNKSSMDAMNTLVSGVRKDYFDSMLASHPSATKEEIREMSRAVSVMTGRADLSDMKVDLNDVDRLLSNKTMRYAFWSPRFAASRPQFYAGLLSRGHLGKEARKTALAQIGTTVTTLHLFAAQSDDWDFPITDPDSKDWLKLVNNKTGERRDVWGGDLPYVRTVARAIMGMKYVAGSGDKAPKTRGFVNDWSEWTKNKVGPLPQLASTVTGYDFLGKRIVAEKDRTPVGYAAAVARGTAGMFVPMGQRDVYDLAQVDAATIPGIGLSAFLSGIGVGVDVHTKDKSKSKSSSLTSTVGTL